MMSKSVKETAVRVVDDAGNVEFEQNVPIWVGIEAGPLSRWLVNGPTAAGLPVGRFETRHMMALLKAQQINKSDRSGARGIAQMMRVGLFKPVHVKTQMAQEQRIHPVGPVSTALPARWDV
jgi:transposase